MSISFQDPHDCSLYTTPREQQDIIVNARAWWFAICGPVNDIDSTVTQTKGKIIYLNN